MRVQMGVGVRAGAAAAVVVVVVRERFEGGEGGMVGVVSAK